MKNNQLITIGAVVIIALIGIFLVINKNKTQTAPVAQNPTTKEIGSTGTTGSTSDSIANLLSRTGSVQCKYTYTPTGGTTSSGTVFISNGKMNGEFQTTVAKKQSTVYMINDGTYSYTWGTDMPEGIKIKNPAVTTGQPLNNQNAKYIDPNQKYDFACNPWGVDPSKFTPPTNVTFRDMSALMDDVQKKAGTANQSQCGACASLTGDQQVQCKKALGCE